MSTALCTKIKIKLLRNFTFIFLVFGNYYSKISGSPTIYTLGSIVVWCVCFNAIIITYVTDRFMCAKT